MKILSSCIMKVNRVNIDFNVNIKSIRSSNREKWEQLHVYHRKKPPPPTQKQHPTVNRAIPIYFPAYADVLIQKHHVYHVYHRCVRRREFVLCVCVFVRTLRVWLREGADCSVSQAHKGLAVPGMRQAIWAVKQLCVVSKLTMAVCSLRVKFCSAHSAFWKVHKDTHRHNTFVKRLCIETKIKTAHSF